MPANAPSKKSCNTPSFISAESLGFKIEFDIICVVFVVTDKTILSCREDGGEVLREDVAASSLFYGLRSGFQGTGKK